MKTNPPNPFKGLRPYEEKDHKQLFGRDKDLILMTDRIFSGRTTLLFAGSGVGKTSFLRAKVIPELRDQYHVVWHNRWTGADELLEHDELTNKRDNGFRGLVAWFSAAFKKILFWQDREIALTDETVPPSSTPEAIGQSEDNFTLEIHKAITKSLRQWTEGEGPRLSKVLSCYRRSACDGAETEDAKISDVPKHKRCILILDQFEEVFQYHGYEDYFRKFITDLCEVINNDEYQVRVVFSMREEFLGELSVFDNKIPDLFTNYYRLRYPDKSEAEQIIRLTCMLSGVAPDETKLGFLVEDLSKIEKSSPSTGQPAGHPKKKVRIIKRTFVAPPYLQIACAGLWNEQYAIPSGKNGSPNAVDDQPMAENERPTFSPFLVQYHPGEESEGETGGDAQRALREFCQQRLSKPYLSETEQDLAARAFGFLVTKQGAKMAYELTSLASHMDVQPAPLRKTLQKLSQDEAKILRESRDPDRSYWFELYHDMYATIVDEWKRGYQLIKKKRDRRRLASWVAAPAMIVFLIFAIPFWITKPMEYRRTLLGYRDQLQKEIDTGDSQKTAKAYSGAHGFAYENMRGTPGWGSYADVLWAEILERRALISQLEGKRDYALLYWLKAATLRFTSAGAQQDLARAEALAGDDRSIKMTYASDCSQGKLSPNGKTVVTIDATNQTTLWDAKSGALIATICSDCTAALFSSDGNIVATLSKTKTSSEPTPPATGGTDSTAPGTKPVAQGKPTPTPTPTAQQTGSQYIVQVWDAASGLKQGASIVLATVKKRIVPGAGTTEEVDTVAPTLLAVAGNQSNYVIAARTVDKLIIGRTAWDKVKEIFATEIYGPEFSPSGEYLRVGIGEKPALWRITEKGTTVDNRITDIAGSMDLAFSPDSKLFLASHSDGKVRVWTLNSNDEPKIVGLADSTFIHGLGFSSSGREFLVVSSARALPRAEVVQVFDTLTLQPLYAPLTLSGSGSDWEFRPETKSFLRTRRVGPGGRLFERWDVSTGKKTGHLLLPGSSDSSFGIDDDSVFAILDRSARLWKLGPFEPRGTVLWGEGQSSYKAASSDGSVLLTEGTNKSQVWDLNSGQELFSLRAGWSPTFSPRGKYLAFKIEQRTVEIRNVNDSSSVNVTFKEDLLASVGMSFSLDEQYLAVASADKIHLLQPPSTTPVTTIQCGPGLDSIRLSPDNKHLIATFRLDSLSSSKANERFTSLRVWSLPDGREIQVAGPFTASFSALAGGNKLIAFRPFSDDATIQVWDLSTRQIKVLSHETSVRTAAISQDGRWIASADRTGVVRLWDALTGDKLGELKLPPDNRTVTFTWGGQHLLIRNIDWIHRFSISGTGLHYLGGMFPGSNDAARISSLDGGQIRFLRQVDDNGVEILNLSFSGKPAKPAFQGDPNELFAAWQKKLGATVNNYGQFSTTQKTLD